MSDNSENIARAIAAMKGLAGSGNALSYFVDKIEGLVATMEPGDFVRSDTNTAVAAPIATDLWYLHYHDNLLKKYCVDEEDADFNHYKYAPYLAANLSFLSSLTGLKPLKVMTDLKDLDIKAGFGSIIPNEYKNNGIYWINTAAFEFYGKKWTAQYASDGPKDFLPNDYVGYISIPIGQLGVMEVISLLQETVLSGYKFTAADADTSKYHEKAAPVLKDDEKPKLQGGDPQMFPDAKNEKGNLLSGQNYCYGRHLIESAYLVPTNPVPSQNALNSEGKTAYAPTPSRDVELFSIKMEKYAEKVDPKLWMRYWIHKDSTLPVPGEFIGFLCRPVATPPHVWWFQESSPFLYAGNWMETETLTSGVITAVTLESARTDSGIGNEYKVKIQGCEVTVYSTDFYDYKVGDRVAIMKLDDTAAPATKSFTWLDQYHFKASDIEEDTAITNYIIAPFTFYKIKK